MKSYISLPQDENSWLKIASEFECKWNFPNAIGAVDGKHVVIKPPQVQVQVTITINTHIQLY